MTVHHGKEIAWVFPWLEMIRVERDEIDESTVKEFVDSVLRKVSYLKEGRGKGWTKCASGRYGGPGDHRRPDPGAGRGFVPHRDSKPGCET